MAATETLKTVIDTAKAVKVMVRTETIDECIAEALKHDSVIDAVNALQQLRDQ